MVIKKSSIKNLWKWLLIGGVLLGLVLLSLKEFLLLGFGWSLAWLVFVATLAMYFVWGEPDE